MKPIKSWEQLILNARHHSDLGELKEACKLYQEAKKHAQHIFYQTSHKQDAAIAIMVSHYDLAELYDKTSHRYFAYSELVKAQKFFCQALSSNSLKTRQMLKYRIQQLELSIKSFKGSQKHLAAL